MNIISRSATDCSGKLTRFLALAALATFGFSSVSCSLFNKNSSSNTGAGGQYAEYTSASDGGYHPYSNPQGYTKPSYQQPAAYQEVSSSHSSSSYASHSSSSGGSTKKKTVASSGSTKKKSTTTKSSASKSGGTVHIVKHGDTLYGLARRYHTTVNAIKKANGKTSDLLRDGEKLRIP